MSPEDKRSPLTIEYGAFSIECRYWTYRLSTEKHSHRIQACFPKHLPIPAMAIRIAAENLRVQVKCKEPAIDMLMSPTEFDDNYRGQILTLEAVE